MANDISVKVSQRNSGANSNRNPTTNRPIVNQKQIEINVSSSPPIVETIYVLDDGTF